jgi:hypothetical protein
VIFLDRVAYFLITRAKAVVGYLKKFTRPRYVIAFVLIYPHIYTNLQIVIQTAQELMINTADQFYSWIEATFWGIYNYVKEKLQNIWFGDQIAYLVAGAAVAFPFLVYIIFKHAFIPIANALLAVSLNVLGAVYYIFCRVVIPALKAAFGAYLFIKFMPASYKYVAKALDRFAQGRFGGFLGALFGTFAPFSMFFIGPLIISTVVDPVCSTAYSPPIIPLPYGIPYAKPELYQYTVAPTMSWIVSSIYGQYLQQQPAAVSYIDASVSWDIRKMISYSYITPNVAFRVYPVGVYGPYYPGAYALPAPTLSTIYASLFYSIVFGYPPYAIPYTISYIFTEFVYGFLTATYSYVFTEVPIFTLVIYDISLLSEPPYIYAYIYDVNYLAIPPVINAEIQSLDYLFIPHPINAEIQDFSYLVYQYYG